ncbi:MAG: sugar transferase [Acidobacteriota bacterium]
MLKQRAKLVTTAQVLLDAALFAAAGPPAYWLKREIVPKPVAAPILEYAASWGMAIVTLSAAFFAFRLYESFRTRTFLSEAFAVSKAMALGTLVLLAVSFLARPIPSGPRHVAEPDANSRALIGFYVGLCYVAVLVERLAIRLVSRWIRERGYNYRTVLIVGTGPKARDFARIIHDHRHWGLKLLGFVSDDAAEAATSINGYDVLGVVADMPQIVDKHVIDEVVMVVAKNRLEELEDTFLLCEEAGIKTRVSVSMFPHLIAKVDLEDMEGVPLLTFSTTPTNEASLVVKRAIDIAISLVLLVVTLPVSLLAAIAIKLDSPGPILFRQVRIGLQGRRFILFKFRSMVEDAASRLKEIQHLNEMDGPVFKMKDDPRLTRVGRVIRRYSIDEIPQLWNVLVGDMCIVGPRPPMPEEVAGYERWQKRRLSMKPGLTCLWQVNGRNRIPFGEWMKLDLQYIDNWSLWLDVKILLATIPVVLSGRGAS